MQVEPPKRGKARRGNSEAQEQRALEGMYRHHEQMRPTKSTGQMTDDLDQFSYLAAAESQSGYYSRGRLQPRERHCSSRRLESSELAFPAVPPFDFKLPESQHHGILEAEHKTENRAIPQEDWEKMSKSQQRRTTRKILKGRERDSKKR